jgi:hypothetical protein
MLIFKSGDKTDLHNDRGISLPNCIAKLNERLIKHYENLFAEIFNDSYEPLILQKSKIASLSFADDLIILSTSHHDLQNALKKLEDYCYKWQLTVNVKKNKSIDISKILLANFATIL